MNINSSIKSNNNLYTGDIAKSKKPSEVNKEVNNEKPELTIVDTYEKTDEKSIATMKKVNEIEAEGKKQIQAFKNMFEKLLNKQDKVYKTATIENDESDEFFVVVDEETKAQAIKDISEGGYYSETETAARIIDFAKTLAGGDINKLAILKEAVESGFDSAAKAWGGDMPEITKATYKLVMKGFEELENPTKNDKKSEEQNIKKAV